jgi:hypothetical protein
MAFAGNFTITPDATDPTSFVITDTSTGSDTNLTDRQILLYQSNGLLLLPAGSTTNYINWPIAAGSTLAINGLITQDYSLNIVVNWISSAPIMGSTYTQTLLYTFYGNTQLFINGLIQQIAANPQLENSYNFMGNLAKLYVYLQNAQNATTFMQQFSAQGALNQCENLIINQSLFFV